MMETLHQKTTQEIAPYQIFMSRHYYKRKIPFSRIFISIIEIIILFYSIDALVHNTILQNKLIYFLLCFSSIIYLSNQFIPLIFDLFHKQITHHSLLFSLLLQVICILPISSYPSQTSIPSFYLHFLCYWCYAIQIIISHYWLCQCFYKCYWYYCWCVLWWNICSIYNLLKNIRNTRSFRI